MDGKIGDGHVLSRPIKPFEGPSRPDLIPKTGDDKNPNFREILSDTIQQVNIRQQDADKAIEDLATGKEENLARVMTAVEKADLAFRTLMQFRNKLLAAYQEINNIRF
ncbi:MAG: flagellar hook-basal body complex protein FliE [Planctomycetes bacterium]|nr:flagellar hook-basal body complex protein FliE [Planctomycetota bacterium]NUQ35016.1 flagellar hook-basal body complex protein FliE [Planctomycetaceae bacterium]